MKQHAVLASIALALVTTTPLAQGNDTLAKLKETGSITLGVRESNVAMSYALGDGRHAGFHIDLCHRVVANVEKAIGRKLDIKYQLVTSQNRIPLLQNGTIDMECGSTTNNATRQKDVAFLPTTFVEEVRIAVKKNSGIDSLEQLDGKTIATTTGATSVQHLRKHQRTGNVSFKELHGKDHDESFLLLQSGRADAFVLDGAILAGNIAVSKNPAEYKILPDVLNVEPIAIMVRKDDPQFRRIGQETVAQMAKSGELATLWDKWFMKPIPPKNVSVGYPLNESTRQAWADLNDRPMEDYAKK
ncbi:amino acid ABC transporter substrate-binding protein [Ramlibacter sp. AN1015]|uniref:amino acid ABC transporter substrate-binding protein n=1 Tax=Ramlibacter sp. AN1015 TaxID=3133428 RepID=UPI0030C5C88C